MTTRIFQIAFSHFSREIENSSLVLPTMIQSEHTIEIPLNQIYINEVDPLPQNVNNANLVVNNSSDLDIALGSVNRDISPKSRFIIMKFKKQCINVISWVMMICMILLLLFVVFIHHSHLSHSNTPAQYLNDSDVYYDDSDVDNNDLNNNDYPPLKSREFLPLAVHGEEFNDSILQFFSFSDVHIDLLYKEPENEEGDYSMGRKGADSPLSLFESTLQSMKRLNPNPEFVIFLGDSIRHDKINENLFKKTYSNIHDLFHAQFPDTLLLPTLGNHDIYPNRDYLEIVDKNPVLEFLAKIWGKWLPFDAVKTVAKGGYYALTIPSTNIKFLSLNTIIYSDDWYDTCITQLTSDECNAQLQSNNGDPFDQFKFIEKELRDSKKNNEKVIIISHMGIGLSRNHKSLLASNFQEQLNHLFIKYSDVISNFIAGHCHRDLFNTFYDPSSASFSGIPMFDTPGITPIDGAFPSFRLNYLSNNSAEIVDYQQFFFNLDQFTIKSSEQVDQDFWQIEYVFSEDYFYPPNKNGIASLFQDLFYYLFPVRDRSNEYIEDEESENTDMISISDMIGYSKFSPQLSAFDAIQVETKMMYFFTNYKPKSFSSKSEIELICGFLFFDIEHFNACVSQLKK